MKVESRLGLLLVTLNILLGQISALPDFARGFFQGLAVSLGLVLIIIGMLPERTYKKLPYRKLIANRKG